ncbi:MAG: hypothetical protein EOM17_10970 [Synergistales bacterium]|nr:hypothetical protein [Synergistales bacterium]
MDGNEPSAQEMRVLAILKAMSVNSYPNLTEWREKCAEEGLVYGPNKEAVVQCMKRILKKLQNLGLIKQGIGRGIWIPCDDDFEEA